MKKRKFLLFFLLLTLFFLSACDRIMDSAAIEKAFNEEYKGVNYQVIEREDYGKVSKIKDLAAYIKARDLDYDFEFTIYSLVLANAPFGIYQDYQSDYFAKKFLKLYETYPKKDSSFQFYEGKDYDKGHFIIAFDFYNKKTLDEKMASLEDLILYIAGEEERVKVYLQPSFAVSKVDNAAGQKDKIYQEIGIDYKTFDSRKNIEENLKGKLSGIKRNIFQEYAVKAQILQLDNKDYPITIIEEFSNNEYNSNYKFRVVVDGKSWTWKDLFSESYNVINYRTLYEILSRTKYPSLQGNKKDFTFTGNDGVKYQFSDSFHDGKYDDMEHKFYKGERANYYLADGEKAFFTLPYTRVLTLDQLEELTGYQFISLWQERKEREAEERKKK